jgi:hypothetical protein
MGKKRVAEKKTKKTSKTRGKASKKKGSGKKKRMSKVDRDHYYNNLWLNYFPHAPHEAEDKYEAKIARAKEFIKACKWHKKNHKGK